MTQKEKLAIIIEATDRLFKSCGKKTESDVLETFATILMPYDIKCLLNAIKKQMLYGDGWPTVQKVLQGYEHEKEKALTDMFYNILERLKNNKATDDEKKIFIECGSCMFNNPNQEMIYKNYKENEKYIESRIAKFIGYFPDVDNPIKIESDILRIDNKKMIGANND